MNYYLGTPGFPHGTAVKNLPAHAGYSRDAVSISGSDDPLKEEMVNHSSIIA